VRFQSEKIVAAALYRCGATNGGIASAARDRNGFGVGPVVLAVADNA